MIRVAVAACVVSLFVADTVAGRDASSSQQVSAKQTVFRDAVAESPAGPDVRLVTVSSDADLLTFRIDVPTHRVLTEDMRLRVWLDADDDRKTGLAVEGLEGFDHHLVVDRWELGYGAVGLFRCSGSVCSGGRDPESSLRFAYADGATFAIEARELGLRRLERVSFSVVVTTGIRFDPVARSYDVTNARLDTAPEPGTVWTYDARVLRVTSFSAAPAKVRAGTLQIMRLGAIRTDTGKVLTKGRVSCSARIDGKVVPVRAQRFVGPRAVCAFAVPANTSGKRFRSTIGIVFGGAEVSRSLSGRIG